MTKCYYNRTALSVHFPIAPLPEISTVWLMYEFLSLFLSSAARTTFLGPTRIEQLISKKEEE